MHNYPIFKNLNEKNTEIGIFGELSSNSANRFRDVSPYSCPVKSIGVFIEENSCVEHKLFRAETFKQGLICPITKLQKNSMY